MDAIGRLLGGVDALFRGAARGVRGALRSVVDGPLVGVTLWLVLLVTGGSIVIGDVARFTDRIIARVERAIVLVAFLAMTFLAFNEYLQRELQPALETDLGGLWALQGQMNMALLLMVVVGFLGASLATHERRHIAVDAVDRVLSPASARFVKRLTSLVAAGVAWMLMRGAWDKVFESSHDAFEGARVWSWMVAPINAMIDLLPGDKYGPGTAYGEMSDWEDAMFDAGLDFDQFPAAFSYVDAGSRFPLWIPVMVLVVALAITAARFLAQSIAPGPLAEASPRPCTRRPIDVILAGAFPGALVALGLGAWLGAGWMILVASILLVLLGAPLFVGVGVGTLACWILLRDASAETVVSDMFEATKKQELLAIPFFVLAGNLMTHGSIASRLIGIAKAWLGWLPGGLGVGAVLACALFAAISGSSPVTVIAIGSIVYPMLIAEGYGERYSVGVLSSAGSLGIIIPPSVPMIVYAVIVGASPEVGAIDPAVLFKAGIGPGMLIATVLVIYTLYLSWPRPGQASIPTTPFDLREALTSLRRGALSLMLPVLILGGIYGWIEIGDFAIRFTVTEAAAISVVYALAIELVIHRELPLKKLPAVFSESAVMMGSLFLILVIAISLNRFFVFEQVPDAATEWMVAHVDSKLTFLIMVNLFLLALGCVMDILSAILIVAPLLAPIAMRYGVDPIHFGIMFIVNLELGYLTPPMGINLFVASTVFERPILSVIRSVVPFLLLMLFCLVVIVWWQDLSLFLVER